MLDRMMGGLALGLLAFLAGCDSNAGAFEAAAQRIADRARPGTMEVIGSSSRLMQDNGRDVRLRYREDGYDFAITLAIRRLVESGPQPCAHAEEPDCAVSLRRRIEAARKTIDVSRDLTPVFAACDLAFADTDGQFGGAGRPVLTRGRAGDVSFKARMLERMPAEPAGTDDPVRKAERCTQLLRERLAQGPMAEGPAAGGPTAGEPGGTATLDATYYFQPEVDLPDPAGLSPAPGAKVGTPRYRVELWAGRDDAEVKLELPFYWGTALETRWRTVATQALARLGMEGRQGVHGTIEPGTETADADRAVVRAHMLIANTRPGTPIDNKNLSGDGLRIEHDLRTDTTRAVCLVRGARRRPTGPDTPPGVKWERDHERTAMPCTGPHATPIPPGQ